VTSTTPVSKPPAPRRILAALLLLLGAYGLGISAISASAESLNGSLITLNADHYGPLFQSTVYHGIVGLLALASGYLLRRGPLPLISPQLFLFVLPFVLLFSADRILNVFFPPALSRSGIFRPHETRGWAMLPKSEMFFGSHIYIDRYGFRVPLDEWDRKIPPRPRILFVGDSLTFGLAIEAEKCYVGLLSKAVQEIDGLPKFHALNAGVTGYDIAQSLDQLRELNEKFKPDLIVQQICFNDISEQYDARHGRDEELYPEYRYMARDPHWSAIARLVFDWARRRKYGGATEQEAAEAIQHMDLMRLVEASPSKTIEDAWERVYKTQREMIAYCKEQMLPLAVVLFPIQQQFTFPETTLDPQRRLAEFFATTDVPYIDISDVYFDQYERTQENGAKLFVDDTHPTRLGHRIAAEAILQLLREHGLLKRAAQRYVTSTR